MIYLPQYPSGLQEGWVKKFPLTKLLDCISLIHPCWVPELACLDRGLEFVMIRKTPAMSKKIKEKKNGQSEKDNLTKPDPETLHKTDPQENMKGPVSSVVQEIKETSEKNDEESKEEADEKKEENK